MCRDLIFGKIVRGQHKCNSLRLDGVSDEFVCISITTGIDLALSAAKIQYSDIVEGLLAKGG
jgi:hypothetical protein